MQMFKRHIVHKFVTTGDNKKHISQKIKYNVANISGNKLQLIKYGQYLGFP